MCVLLCVFGVVDQLRYSEFSRLCEFKLICVHVVQLLNLATIARCFSAHYIVGNIYARLTFNLARCFVALALKAKPAVISVGQQVQLPDA